MRAGRCSLVFMLSLALSGCATFREIVGMPGPGEPSVTLKSAEARWLLIKNPRFGDVPSEPQYVWVEEDKVPTTFRTVFMGKQSIIAAPEVVAKYGRPPGGGKISSRQGVPSQAPELARNETAAAVASTPAPPAPRPEATRGFVVFVDTTRIAIDLTAADGVRTGTVVSLRRDRIPIVHPVTGEVLGELDQEIGTARVVELRDRFSVAEIEVVEPGAQIRVRDRVVPK
ncbi:MAG: hypothetical protein ACREK6_10650 [Candidatus Rokuibacteriota bacterium]